MPSYTIPAFAATRTQLTFLSALQAEFGSTRDTFSRGELAKVAKDRLGAAYPPAWIVKDTSRNVGRAMFSVPELPKFAAGEYGTVDAPTASSAGASPKVRKPKAPKALSNAVGTSRRHRTVAPSIPTAGPAFVAAQPVIVASPAPAPAAAVAAVTAAPTSLRLAEVDQVDDPGLTPHKPAWFVPGSMHKTLVALFSSKVFAPVFIYGHKGTGKTTGLLAAAAETGRKVYRVNITSETCEDDLIGGMRLINGDTVWADGPVVQAMKSGSILLLDEMDRGDRKILCLQPILEGNPCLIKKTGRVVIPTAGFTVVATGNTRGRGSDDNRYSGANIQDEALLDRFPIAFRQDFADEASELRMLAGVQTACGYEDATLSETLVRWAKRTRDTFTGTGEGDFITTRNLVDICRIFPILGDANAAVAGVCGKFEPEVGDSFVALFKACYGDVRNAAAAAAASSTGNDPTSAPAGAMACYVVGRGLNNTIATRVEDFVPSIEGMLLALGGQRSMAKVGTSGYATRSAWLMPSSCSIPDLEAAGFIVAMTDDIDTLFTAA